VSGRAGSHPLARILRSAALGSPPDADGEVEILPAVPGAVEAVCSFTAHSVVAVDLPASDIRAHLDPGDLGSAMSAPFLAWVGDATRTTIGVLDAVLVAPERAEPEIDLLERDDLLDHPRVSRSARYRSDIRVFADRSGAGILIIGRGLAGRWEMAFEVDEPARGRGLGRKIAASAPMAVAAAEPLFAQCSPGNAGSLRALIAAGYVPVGSECLFLRPNGAGVG
jgi:GNAT superfamily N-acetyltransferase